MPDETDRWTRLNGLGDFDRLSRNETYTLKVEQPCPYATSESYGLSAEQLKKQILDMDDKFPQGGFEFYYKKQESRGNRN